MSKNSFPMKRMQMDFVVVDTSIDGLTEAAAQSVYIVLQAVSASEHQL